MPKKCTSRARDQGWTAAIDIASWLVLIISNGPAKSLAESLAKSESARSIAEWLNE